MSFTKCDRTHNPGAREDTQTKSSVQNKETVLAIGPFCFNMTSLMEIQLIECEKDKLILIFMNIFTCPIFSNIEVLNCVENR